MDEAKRSTLNDIARNSLISAIAPATLVSAQPGWRVVLAFEGPEASGNDGFTAHEIAAWLVVNGVFQPAVMIGDGPTGELTLASTLGGPIVAIVPAGSALPLRGGETWHETHATHEPSDTAACDAEVTHRDQPGSFGSRPKVQNALGKQLGWVRP